MPMDKHVWLCSVSVWSIPFTPPPLPACWDSSQSGGQEVTLTDLPVLLTEARLHNVCEWTVKTTNWFHLTDFTPLCYSLTSWNLPNIISTSVELMETLGAKQAEVLPPTPYPSLPPTPYPSLPPPYPLPLPTPSLPLPTPSLPLPTPPYCMEL